jgi:hypothetical protein
MASAAQRTDRSEQRVIIHPSASFLHRSAERGCLSLRDSIFITFKQNLYPAEHPEPNGWLTKCVKDLEIDPALTLADLYRDSPLARIARKIYRGQVDSIVSNERMVYRLACVRSRPELEAKPRLLAELRRRAQAFYFDNGGRFTKFKIDLALVKAASGATTIRDWILLDRYWHLYTDEPWAWSAHQKLEEELIERIRLRNTMIVQDMEAERNPRFNTTYGATLKQRLLKGFDRVTSSLQAEAEETKTRPDQKLRLEYMVLKLGLLRTPCTQEILNKILEPLIAQTPAEIRELARAKEEKNASLRKTYQSELDSIRCCIDREKLRKHYVDPTDDYLDIVLAYNAADQRKYWHCMIDLEDWTPEDYIDVAKGEWGFKTAELQAVIDEATPYDRTVGQYLSLVLAPDPYEQSDLLLDLSCPENVVDLFVQRLRACDEKALRIVTSYFPKAPKSIPGEALEEDMVLGSPIPPTDTSGDLSSSKVLD